MGRIKGKEPKKGKRIAPPPQVPPLPNYDSEPPVFCFRYLDKTYGLDSCTKDEKAALVSTLYKLSQLSWKELRLQPRHGLGIVVNPAPIYNLASYRVHHISLIQASPDEKT